MIFAPRGHYFTLPHGYGAVAAGFQVGAIFNHTKQQLAAEGTVLFSTDPGVSSRSEARGLCS
jgi:hypothetical protein